jgi:protein arginine kinase
MLDDLTKTPGEWLRGGGPLGDVVISSRIRLARNLAGFPFLSTATETDRAEIYRCACERVSAIAEPDEGFLLEIHELDELERMILVERHLISRQQAEGEGTRGVLVWPDERRAVMINEEDHLRIQGLRTGLQLDALWEDINRLDDSLAETLAYAFDRRLGYLTACPTNVGTGIRVSVMVHLPALKLAQEIERMARAMRDMHLAVRGLYGEGTDAIGDLYQVSNQTTLGKSETEIIRFFADTVIPKLVEYEQAARAGLAREHVHQLDDRIWRAYGTLANARCIGTEETLALLSHLRMGIHMDRFDRVDIATINELFLTAQPAHLQKLVGRALEGSQRAVARADLLRRRLTG